MAFFFQIETRYKLWTSLAVALYTVNVADTHRIHILSEVLLAVHIYTFIFVWTRVIVSCLITY